ncbi:MAG: hypothetical protein GY783_12385, partial [Gammaproteobacteria bacterium]|nr:hypothetical protein [Gammaproteobacteria bacterium]
ADVRGFSAYSQSHASSDVYGMIKEIFNQFTKIVEEFNGTIKDFAGDAVFVFWEHRFENGATQSFMACQAAVQQMHNFSQLRVALTGKYADIEKLQMGWGITTGPIILSHLGFNVVEFSPDGHNLLASIHDGTIYGWAIPSREPLFEPITGAHTSHLLKLAFSPAGDRLATASTDGTAMVLEFPSGGIIGPAFGNDDRIGSVVFSPDGRVLIGGNADGAMSLWDVERQAPIVTTPRGHSQAIVDAELSEDGRLLATLGRDQVIRLWSFDSTYPLANERQVSERLARGVAFSSDGKQ